MTRVYCVSSGYDVEIQLCANAHPLIDLIGILDDAVSAIFGQVEHTKLPWMDATQWHDFALLSLYGDELTR